MTIEEYNAKLDALTKERVEIDRQITETQLAKMAAQREISRNKKLPPGMAKTLCVMFQRDAVMVRSSYSAPGSVWLDWADQDHDDPDRSQRNPTFEGLREREMIEEGERHSTWTREWRLTEWGKQVASKLIEQQSAAEAGAACGEGRS